MTPRTSRWTATALLLLASACGGGGGGGDSGSGPRFVYVANNFDEEVIAFFGGVPVSPEYLPVELQTFVIE